MLCYELQKSIIIFSEFDLSEYFIINNNSFFTFFTLIVIETVLLRQD